MSSVIDDAKALIEPLRNSGYEQLANILDHRLHRVAWTTGTELQEELRKVLEGNVLPDDLRLKEHIRNILKRL